MSGKAYGIKATMQLDIYTKVHDVLIASLPEQHRQTSHECYFAVSCSGASEPSSHMLSTHALGDKERWTTAISRCLNVIKGIPGGGGTDSGAEAAAAAAGSGNADARQQHAHPAASLASAPSPAASPRGAVGGAATTAGIAPAASREKRWELPKSCFELYKKIGSGECSTVFKGVLLGKTEVAIKAIRPGILTKESVLKEVTVLKQLRHPRIVELICVCTDEDPVWIVTEYMPNGNLRDFLHGVDRAAFGPVQKLTAAIEIAEALVFLQEKAVVHRDVAARNCLVRADGRCKLADFGLARLLPDDGVYFATIKKGLDFSIKWTAPESIKHSTFDTNGDVWSFGVLLFEVATLGGEPYPGLDESFDLANQIMDGYRMLRPAGCSEKLYELMMLCWSHSPAQRPPFAVILGMLKALCAERNQGDAAFEQVYAVPETVLGAAGRTAGGGAGGGGGGGGARESLVGSAQPGYEYVANNANARHHGSAGAGSGAAPGARYVGGSAPGAAAAAAAAAGLGRGGGSFSRSVHAAGPVVDEENHYDLGPPAKGQRARSSAASGGAGDSPDGSGSGGRRSNAGGDGDGGSGDGAPVYAPVAGVFGGAPTYAPVYAPPWSGSSSPPPATTDAAYYSQVDAIGSSASQNAFSNSSSNSSGGGGGGEWSANDEAQYEEMELRIVPSASPDSAPGSSSNPLAEASQSAVESTPGAALVLGAYVNLTPNSTSLDGGGDEGGGGGGGGFDHHSYVNLEPPAETQPTQQQQQQQHHGYVNLAPDGSAIGDAPPPLIPRELHVTADDGGGSDSSGYDA